MKAKKWLIVVLSAVMALAVGLGVAACGPLAKPDHQHTYDAWDHDETEHWMYCDEHGEDKTNIDETTRAPHVYDQEGNTKCVCGAEKPAEEHQHSYTEWKYDANQHWKVCPEDQAVDPAGKANHVYDQEGNTKCVCGAEKPQEQHTHTYDAYDYDNDQHWLYCDEHGADKSNIKDGSREPHDFTNGNCVCGKEKPDPEHTHTYDAWDYDATDHWQYCDDHGEDKSNVKADSKVNHTGWDYVNNGANHTKKTTCTEHTPYTVEENHDFTNGDCICGAKKPHEHTPSEYFVHDETQHWHVCTEDQEIVGEKAAHNLVKQADGTFKCECGHTMSAWGMEDETYHAQHSICEGEYVEHETITKREQHTYADGENKCQNCEFEKAPATQYLYLIGNVANANFNFENLVALTPIEGGKFKLTITLFAGEEFKIINSATENPTDWPSDDNLAYDFYDLAGDAATDANFKHPDKGEWNIVATKDGTYTFTVDPSKNNGAGVITYTREEVQWDLYYYGGLTGWAKNEAYQLTTKDGGATYTIEVTVEAAEQFKIVNITNDLAKYFDNNTGNNIEIKKAGKYTVTFTTATKTIEFAEVVPPHTHTYDAWDFDETNHWKYCDEHGEDKTNIDEATRAPHVYNQEGETCVCGKVNPDKHEHNYDAWDYDETGHWLYCDDHGEDKTNTKADSKVAHTDWKYTNNGANHTKKTTCTEHAPYTIEEEHDYESGEEADTCICGAKKPVDADTRAFYIVGNYANCIFDWASARQMTIDAENGHLFTITVLLYKGEAFKIVGFDQAQTVAPDDLWGLTIDFADYADEQKTFTAGEMGNIVAPKTGYFLIKLYTNDTYQQDDDSFSINIEDAKDVFAWDLYIYGTMNEWGKGENEIKMTAGENNTYTAQITIEEKDLQEDQKGNKYAAFKVVNLNKEVAKYFGGQATEDNPDGNFWLTKADTYTITFHTDTFEIEIKGENEDKPIPDGDTRVFYVTGDLVGGNGFSWPEKGELPLKMTRTDAYTYEITLLLYKGEKFKIIGFASAQLTPPENMWGLQVEADDLSDICDPAVQGSGTDIMVTAEGYYTVKLYTNDEMNTGNDNDKFSLVITKDDDAIAWNLYIFGTMNATAWTEDANFKMEGSTTSYTKTFTTKKANEEFKVANVTKEGLKYFDMGDGKNIKLAAIDEYTVTFDTTTYTVTVKGKTQEDVPHDQRTFVLSGSSTETKGSLYGNAFGYDTTKLAFVRTPGTNTFVLKDVTLYAGDKMQIRYNADWDDGSGSTHYAYGAHFLINDTTCTAGKVFDTSNVSEWWGDAVIATGMSGVYDITIQPTGTTCTSKTTVGENQAKFTFTKKSELPDPDRSVIEFFIVGTVKANNQTDKWPGAGVSNSEFVSFTKTNSTTYTAEIKIVSSDSFKIYCATYGSWHTLGKGQNGNNITGKTGSRVTITITEGAKNLVNADPRVTVTLS